MALVSTLRNQLKTRLDTISGLNAYARWPRQAPNAPVAIPLNIGAEHEQTFGNTTGRDLSLFNFEILVAVPLGQDLDDAEDKLGGYVSNTGADSIRAALDGDRTLGGTCHCLFFGTWTGPDEEPINGQNYLGQRLEVRVWAS